MITITVASGDTLSGIAAQHSTTWQHLASINHLANPDFITVGEKILVSKGGWSSWRPSSSPPATSYSSPSHSSGGSSSPSSLSGSSTRTSPPPSGTATGYHIPGVSDAVAACIAFKESTNGQASPNVFQLTQDSGQGYYPGESLAQQEAAAGKLAASQGVHNAWGRYDGC